jgi:hypothetical protein
MASHEIVFDKHGEEAVDAGQERSTWEGSDVTQSEFNWLRQSWWIPQEVQCRLLGVDPVPILHPDEYIVFVTHFERGFGLPAIDFFR